MSLKEEIRIENQKMKNGLMIKESILYNHSLKKMITNIEKSN